MLIWSNTASISPSYRSQSILSDIVFYVASERQSMYIYLPNVHDA